MRQLKTSLEAIIPRQPVKMSDPPATMLATPFLMVRYRKREDIAISTMPSPVIISPRVAMPKFFVKKSIL
jgi:hypothetical protein